MRSSRAAMLTLDKLDEFARTLPNEKLPVMEAMTTPIWLQIGV